jgi:hypothetical protein
MGEIPWVVGFVLPRLPDGRREAFLDCSQDTLASGGVAMDKSMLVGLWRLTFCVPPAIWKRMGEGGGDPLAFMAAEHHRVRDYAVMELVRSGQPLAPERIAQEVQLAQTRVVEVLDELEQHKTFLFRNAQGAVTWAYPVTVEPTPHAVHLSTGEEIHAA